MPAYLEVDLAVVGVQHVPDHAHLVLIQHVADAECEVVGIHLLRLLVRFQREGHLAVALGNQLEVGVAGESVTRQVVFLAVHAIGVVVHAAHDGEEDGRVARPELRISLPQVFLAVCVFDTLELSSLFGDRHRELFVFKFYHSCNVFGNFCGKGTNYSANTEMFFDVLCPSVAK